MFKFLIPLALLFTSCSAEDWKIHRIVKLKKDKIEKILVRSESYEKLLTFRWTLYHNKWLVFFVSFNGFVQQHLLALNNYNQSIRIDLLTRGRTRLPPPMMLIKFKKFDFIKNRAHFELLMRDKDDKIELKFLNKRVGVEEP